MADSASWVGFPPACNRRLARPFLALRFSIGNVTSSPVPVSFSDNVTLNPGQFFWAIANALDDGNAMLSFHLGTQHFLSAVVSGIIPTFPTQPTHSPLLEHRLNGLRGFKGT